MPTNPIRDAVMAGIARRTRELNATLFPQCNPEWTDTQKRVYELLNGESSVLNALHESHKPEVTKVFTELAGIQIKSRFTDNESINVTPYTIIVLRERMEDYPESFPIIKSRISGYMAENGRGSGKNLTLRVRHVRPVTEDDINSFARKFPEDKLSKLWGAIDFPSDKKLRALIVETITKRTAEFGETLKPVYPEGVTEKGLAIMKLGLAPNTIQALSIVLDDPKMIEPWQDAPDKVVFAPFVAIYHTRDTAGSHYFTDRVHVQANGNPHDIFFSLDGEISDGPIGNHADSYTANFRVATPDEIKTYVKELPKERLHLYVEALTQEQISSLL